MSSGSKSSGTQTVTQKTELPDWQEKHLKRIAGDAGKIYDSGYGGFDPYPGATYVPMVADEQRAVNMTRSQIGNNRTLLPALQAHNAINFGDGMLSGQRQALSGAKQATGGFKTVYNQAQAPSRSEAMLGRMGTGGQSLHQRFGGLLAGPTAAQQNVTGIAGGDELAGQDGMGGWMAGSAPLSSEKNLAGIARGEFLGGSNPYLDDIIDNATRRAGDATSSLFSGAGRYGGAAHQGVAAREAADIATDFLGREYDAERQRQLQASGLIDSATLGRRGQELQGLGQMADMDATRRSQQIQASGLLDNALLDRVGAQAGLVGSDLDRRMQAAGQMDDARAQRLGQAISALQGQAGTALSTASQHGDARDALQRNIAMAPDVRAMQFDDANRLMALGAGQRGELQAELQNNIARWNDEQMSPIRELELYQGLVSGLPDLSTRISNTSGTIPRGSPISGLLGGGLAGAGAGAAFGPIGAGVGGLLGALGGILG